MIGASTMLGPVFVQVALTFALLVWTGMLRVGTVTSGGVRPRDVALRQPNWPARVTQVANAYENQLELPLLFYLVILLSFFTARASVGVLVLAWLFVASRVLHALVHVTTNSLGRRFVLFLTGALILMAMWVIFLLDVYFGH